MFFGGGTFLIPVCVKRAFSRAEIGAAAVVARRAVSEFGAAVRTALRRTARGKRRAALAPRQDLVNFSFQIIHLFPHSLQLIKNLLQVSGRKIFFGCIG